MSNPFIGEIRMFGGNFAPNGWAFCNGQLLSIAENDALFNLIGTTYGGDGQQTFALPDLQGRVPLHQGPGHVIGAPEGSESVTLSLPQLPPHDPPISSGNAATLGDSYGGNLVGDAGNSGTKMYGTGSPVAMDPSASSSVGGNVPHENMMPFQCINFIISLFGVYPSQN
jgi:microcystin-dependent protein